MNDYLYVVVFLDNTGDSPKIDKSNSKIEIAELQNKLNQKLGVDGEDSSTSSTVDEDVNKPKRLDNKDPTDVEKVIVYVYIYIF